MRQLTKAQVSELETLKLHVLTNLKFMQPVTAEDITKIVSSNKKMPENFKKPILKDNISPTEMPMEEYKKRIVGTYLECFYEA